jgi:signal transduction histidine kinase
MTTPAAKVSRTSAVNPRVGPHPGMLLAGAYLGAGVLGYLLAGPTPQGSSLPVLWAAIAIAAVTATVLNRPNPLPPTVAPWVCPAIVGPVAIYPLFGLVLAPESSAPALAGLLLLAATLPMVLAIVRLPPTGSRYLARSVVPALGLAYLLLVVPDFAGSTSGDGPQAAATTIGTAMWAAHLLVVTALSWPPSAALFVLLRRPRAPGPRPADEVIADAALLAAAIGPVVTASVLFLPWIYALSLIGLAALAVFAGSRVAVRPLAAISARAAAQRDLAVATSEAERARLAADLHDGPLQDLLLLARSLEARNDAEGARLARDVADELREMSGDLRLPVLDDLGTGPALEWLAARVRRLTGLDVATEWEADGRPPGQVELAAFRVAQEAVSNAVRHGRPPIRVRCRCGADTLRLTIEDAGDGRGLEVPAPRTAPDGMRRGLLGMAQRAEQIGAALDVRRGDSCGTMVVLEWESPSA